MENFTRIMLEKRKKQKIEDIKNFGLGCLFGLMSILAGSLVVFKSIELINLF